MSDLFTCPADGCDWGPKPKDSVAAHYTGKKPDTGHPGGWEKAMILLDEQGSSAVVDDPAETSSSSDGLEFPANPDRDDPEPEDGCPDCGSEDFYNATQVLRSTDLGGEKAKLLREHDRVCSECGEVYS